MAAELQDPNRHRRKRAVRASRPLSARAALANRSGEDLMTIRTTSRTVTFRRPFALSGIVEEQPPGTYIVETDEELLQASVPAYRRISTLLRLPGRPGSTLLGQVVDIDPADLAAALARDAEPV